MLALVAAATLTVGSVTFDARNIEARNNDSHTRVTARRADGTVLLREVVEESGDHHLRAFHVRGVPSPLVLLTIYAAAADGIWITARLYVVGDRVREAVDLSAITRSTEDLCIDRRGVTVGTKVFGAEATLAPHRYNVTRFRWNGRAFARDFTRITKGRHESFADARRELGIVCRDRIAQVAYPELK